MKDVVSRILKLQNCKRALPAWTDVEDFYRSSFPMEFGFSGFKILNPCYCAQPNISQY